jgi:hypothetical protein
MEGKEIGRWRSRRASADLSILTQNHTFELIPISQWGTLFLVNQFRSFSKSQFRQVEHTERVDTYTCGASTGECAVLRFGASFNLVQDANCAKPVIY